MKITREMTMELNNELAVMGCPFRYKYVEQDNPQIEITLPSMNYVDSFIVNPTVAFFDWLIAWFKVSGVELSRNNDGSIFWSKSGWDQR